MEHIITDYEYAVLTSSSWMRQSLVNLMKKVISRTNNTCVRNYKCLTRKELIKTFILEVGTVIVSCLISIVYSTSYFFPGYRFFIEIWEASTVCFIKYPQKQLSKKLII